MNKVFKRKLKLIQTCDEEEKKMKEQGREERGKKNL